MRRLLQYYNSMVVKLWILIRTCHKIVQILYIGQIISASTIVQYIFTPGWSINYVNIFLMFVYIIIICLESNIFNHLFTIRKCNKNSAIVSSLSIRTLFVKQLALAFKSKAVMQQLWIRLNMQDTGASCCIC